MTDPVRVAEPPGIPHSDLLRPPTSLPSQSSLCLCVSVVNLFSFFPNPEPDFPIAPNEVAFSNKLPETVVRNFSTQRDDLYQSRPGMMDLPKADI